MKKIERGRKGRGAEDWEFGVLGCGYCLEFGIYCMLGL
jgi:hypothetical protein